MIIIISCNVLIILHTLKNSMKERHHPVAQPVKVGVHDAFTGVIPFLVAEKFFEAFSKIFKNFCTISIMIFINFTNFITMLTKLFKTVERRQRLLMRVKGFRLFFRESIFGFIKPFFSIFKLSFKMINIFPLLNLLFKAIHFRLKAINFLFLSLKVINFLLNSFNYSCNLLCKLRNL
ncbi:peptidase S11 D-alanyl-D-alanine carboxypeptidase 1, putative [Babesia ovata]|uniref:Peptidase S11 D-alanyl-D-alanine carboxypeptidase 1, putative n=1 Tax=Babesia ovata TaxID=189622 RepID=A0A2H6KJS1_9APIC|nr:peptidase S11 D-alanyl-D-alanine carboxypeptidase 1, putative [Babesia ovata]GBE63244.1 peptidase S11 D-alanyl-D-alanine carboxypeptidase 1, putative [Babesia ovata]